MKDEIRRILLNMNLPLKIPLNPANVGDAWERSKMSMISLTVPPVAARLSNVVPMSFMPRNMRTTLDVYECVR